MERQIRQDEDNELARRLHGREEIRELLAGHDVDPLTLEPITREESESKPEEVRGF